MRREARYTPTTLVNFQSPTPNAQRDCAFFLEVGSWELGVGSWKLKTSVNNAVDEPRVRFTVVEQPVGLPRGEHDVPLVAVPERRVPPRARRPPWSGTCRHTPSRKAASIRRHAHRLSFFHANTNRDWMSKASQCRWGRVMKISERSGRVQSLWELGVGRWELSGWIERPNAEGSGAP